MVTMGLYGKNIEDDGKSMCVNTGSAKIVVKKKRVSYHMT